MTSNQDVVDPVDEGDLGSAVSGSCRCRGTAPWQPEPRRSHEKAKTDPPGDRGLVASKTGGQLGADAYLQVFPDDDIVIAVLSNRRGATDDNPNSHDTADVGAYIGQLMIDALP